MNERGLVLVVPAFEKGRGGGHIVRSVSLTEELRELGFESYLFIPRTPETGSGSAVPVDPGIRFSAEDDPGLIPWDLIVLDRFRTDRQEFVYWSSLGPVLGIDEGGPSRDDFDFLLDLLPALPGTSPANWTLPELLPLPQNRRPSFDTVSPDGRLRILVSFGLEDSASLGMSAAESASRIPGTLVDLILPRHSGEGPPDPARGGSGIRVRGPVPALRETLAGYDLVITHYGLTAFEVLRAKVPVLLISPTEYHEKLARSAGFFSLGTGTRGLKNLRKQCTSGYESVSGFVKKIRTICSECAARHGIAGDPVQTLGSFIGKLNLSVPEKCPACGDERTRAHGNIGRFSHRTYRRCAECGMVYMLRAYPSSIHYGEDYFFEDYRRQYGKTYLEDFPNLVEAGKKRISRIRALASRSNTPDDSGGPPRLLDIGCAYGPFLEAARSEGFSCVGIDPSESAVRYVREKLTIAAYRGFFPEFRLPDFEIGDGFDVVSLWYVIEHFTDPGFILHEISRLLKPGGILACSTPSFSGISGRTKPEEFLRRSPEDHWTIWEPEKTGNILKKQGFSLEKIVTTGHHPERFPVIGPRLRPGQGAVYWFLGGLSRRFRLGDTYEFYGVKETGERSKTWLNG
ncbi:methyltransferase domain-containing protein [Breznakiella homolactica]|uniref:Methyltransferase domain-containing protein n=1 Tax=Breznakiella homolactica TaxID=2798577 RepID=A0A7T7XL57_9SPIR|nr:methyltransferase domain-containing protein [Breznakiella homolactica]QQO08409.1 methyltransferase domain-containing protein [Breznakiella homolactica]